jgi:hypothetical protein
MARIEAKYLGKLANSAIGMQRARDTTEMRNLFGPRPQLSYAREEVRKFSSADPNT